MKISLNWIKDFVDIGKQDPQKLADLLTLRTAEVEGVEDLSKDFDNIVVGVIKKIKPHPDADKLKLAETSIGDKTVVIVCGGSNIYEGMYGPVALAGAKVKWHGEDELMVLKPTKVRGVMSDGMLCTAEELDLESQGHDVIMDLTDMGVKEGTPLSEILSSDDKVLEVDNKSLTHRPDLWGHYGIAREIAAVVKKPFKKLDLSGLEFPAKGDSPAIEIKDFDLCPRYCGVIVKNVKVEKSPKWLQDRLLAVGHRPISNIVDITNYVMAELGQPLHAFDKDFIKGGIVVRRAEKGEVITSLDGQKRKLTEEMLVIADHEKSVAIAGIMGGENSEINENTTEIIIESANFNAQSIRTTSTKLGLRTEAVQRFEKSLDPVLAETAIKRTVQLILKLCPQAEIAGPITDIKKFDAKSPEVDLNVETVSKKIGVQLTAADCTKLLEPLEFEVKKKSEKVLHVKVPTFRATKDIDIEDDLVEEIARMYGYENITAILPHLPTKVPTRNVERSLKHLSRSIWSGFGFSEVYNYSFYSEDDIAKTLMKGKAEKHHLKIENYLSQDQTHLRVTLIPNLLKNVAGNLRFFQNFQLFEFGRTYIEEGKFFPIEEKWLAGAVVLPKKAKVEVFYEAKAYVEEYLRKFLKRDVNFTSGKNGPAYLHPSRNAMIFAEGTELEGGVFEVHPMVLKNYDIDAKVAMFEINFTKLCALEEKIVKYKEVPKFPGMDIDVSVVIDKKVTVAEMMGAIKDADEKLIENVDLFDIYEGENMEEGKKALAFKVLMQAEDRTLTDEEMAGVQKKIFANLQKAGGTIRGI